MKHLTAYLCAAAMTLALCGCHEPESRYPDYKESLPGIEITSENLHDGVWDSIISHSAGQDSSPQLSWTAVEGAGAYAVWMTDPDGRGWLHWKTGIITETALPCGYAESSTYIGPYPPEGQTHHYIVYVAALRHEVTDFVGVLDAVNPDLDDNDYLQSLDGDDGNVLAWGSLEGTFTS